MADHLEPGFVRAAAVVKKERLRTVAVVTGAAGGIGGAIARRLTASGWSVLGIDEERLSPIAGCKLLRLDVTDPDAASKIGRSGPDKWSCIALCAAVGPLHPDPIRIVAVNLLSQVNMIETFRNRMRPGSTVILFGSTAGLRRRYRGRLRRLADLIVRAQAPPAADVVQELNLLVQTMPPGEAYAFSKWCLLRYFSNVTRSALESGVRVQLILCGPTSTRMSEMFASQHPDKWKALLAQAPFGAPNSAEDVADIATSLLAPAYWSTTGTLVLADGGWSVSRGKYVGIKC